MTAPDLVSVRFLGRSTRVSRAFAAKLARVEAALRAEYAAEQLVLPAGAPQPTFGEWHGVTSVGGWRRGRGYHPLGRAVDLNYLTNGYPAVATTLPGGRVVYGGEAGGARFAGVREAFVGAVARACASAGVPCDLSARRRGESTGAVWDRWHAASEAVRAYLAPWYPAVDALDVGEDDVAPGVDPAEIPPPVRDDYAALRVPLVVGAPARHPRTTRNPARGLLDLRRAVVVALCDVGGMRWGACDFGAASSGDVMHFDDARRIASGA